MSAINCNTLNPATEENGQTVTADAVGYVPPANLHLDVTNPEPPVYISEGQPVAEPAQGGEEEDEADQPARSGCSAFCAKWKFVFAIIGLSLCTGLSGIVMNPILPGIKRRYFGSDKDAAFWTTLLQAISAAGALVICPISGYAMDYFGRRPFFLLSTGFSVIPTGLMLIFYPNPVPYMVASAVGNLITGSYSQTYIADHYSNDKTRMMAFAFVMGAGSISTAAGFVVTALPEKVCLMFSVGMAGLSFIYAFFVIGESLPKEKLRGGAQVIETTVVDADGSTRVVQELTQSGKFEWSKIENPFRAMRAVMNNKITICTVIIFGLFQVSQSGVGEVYFYYLNEKVGFDKGDNALVLLEAGTLWPLVLFLLVPFLKKVCKIHSVTLMMFSIACLAGELTMMCVVNAKWQIFAIALPLAGLVNMSFPSIVTVIADGSNGEDQGRRQAGLAAIGDFFGTLAPLFFGQIYSHTNKELSFLPFAIAAVLTLPAFFLASRLRRWMLVLGQRALSRGNSAAPTPRSSKHAFSVYEEAIGEEQHTSVDVSPLLASAKGCDSAVDYGCASTPTLA